MGNSHRPWLMPLALCFFASGALKAESIFDFGVVSTGSFRSRECDVQGSLAAGGDVDLTAFALGTELSATDRDKARLLVGGDFHFVGGTNDLGRSEIQGAARLESVIQRSDLRVGGPVDFQKVTMSGVLKAVDLQPQLRLSSIPAVVPTSPFSLNGEIATLTDEMHRRSKFYRTLKGYSPTWDGYPYRYAVLRAGTRSLRTVYTLTESSWRMANGLRIVGPEGAVIVINVLGKRPDMIRKSMVLVGGIELNTVLLNFPEAEEMTIAQSGTNQGTSSILAPRALVHHTNNLVTGSLLVREYDGDFPHCGQVNHHGGDRFPDLEEIPPVFGE